MPCDNSVYAMVRNLYGLFVYISQSDPIDMTVSRKLVIRCAITDESAILLIITDDNYGLFSG